MLEAARGNRVAFETLYDRYFDKLCVFAGNFLGSRSEAEDVVQEVFIRVIETPDSFDPTRKFSTWIYSVTLNRCRNRHRDLLNRESIAMSVHQEKQEEILAPGESAYDRQLIRRELEIIRGQLNEKEKQLYQLRFEEELSIKEIAGIMDIPEGSAKSGIYYMIKKIAAHLKKLEYETQDRTTA